MNHENSFSNSVRIHAFFSQPLQKMSHVKLRTYNAKQNYCLAKAWLNTTLWQYSIVKCASVLVFIYINVETESACQLLPRLSRPARSTLCVTASSTSSGKVVQSRREHIYGKANRSRSWKTGWPFVCDVEPRLGRRFQHYSLITLFSFSRLKPIWFYVLA